MPQLHKIVICGVGLIGGSFALALKQAGAVREVVGMGRTTASLEEAQRLGVIDRYTTDWADALRDADLLMLAMPVGHTEATLRQLAPHLGPTTIISDAGSTKQDVVAAAYAALGGKAGRFVPGHPIAGAEKSGVAAAQANLFRERRVVLTPLAENSAAAVALVRDAWLACGAEVSKLTAATHDAIFAAVSHLPHLLAYALVHEFANRENADRLFGFAAGGFRDFTRIASSHPEMWRDICLANRTALIRELDAYQAELIRARVLLASADGPGLEALFGKARSARDTWLATQHAATDGGASPE
ncbi:Prephenate dehydrogenase [Sterolibacterium denitrificans]|uniref:prephenate dehydrogenase n=1 Tax=Sterolibacterium denitrificans TaxID=157592 RepID=A0A7Z7HT29_9PROT|nr:prephenate dehydrogenase/arogenate dehydrogenase family protein [Sterolibacterium denitrificans]SMB28882.1 Prephenate dehydrogenase [Sterolibacterium denitrificans]